MLVRARRSDDAVPCLDMARAVYAVDGYPPRGPIDIDHFLAPPQQLAAWVAETDGVIVGHAALHLASAPVTMAYTARHANCEADELAVVARVLVHPEARRSGIARALLYTAAVDAHRRGRRPVLDVAVQLTGAVKLYEIAGWERAGTVTITIDGEPDLDCYVYVGPDFGG